MVHKRISLKIMIIFLLCTLPFFVVLTRCQPASIETTTQDNTVIDIPTAQATMVPTEIQTPPATPSPSPLLPTLEPTATAEPIVTAIPEPTTIPSPWLIDQSSPFFFFSPGNNIWKGYPDGQYDMVTEGRVVEGQPWSPDRTKFIFKLEEYNTSVVNLFIADLQTGQVQSLDFIQRPYDIFWSPDGQYLLYPGGVGRNIQITLYDFITGYNTVLATISREHQGVYYYFVGWSPDSRKVAYVAENEGQYDLFVVDVETLVTQQLTNDLETEVYVSWSPVDNQLLVATTIEPNPFVSPPFAAQELYIMDENGAGRRQLTEFEKLYQLAWSPDGRQVAVSEAGHLCILTLDDLAQTCPLETIFPAGASSAILWGYPPAWSPDGNWLAFQADMGQNAQYITSFVLNLSTNEIVNLDVLGTTPFYWSPAVP